MIPYIEKKYFLLTDKSPFGNKENENDIAITCPICKEGKSYGRKKRLHLYIKPQLQEPLVHCFNCGFQGNMYTYLKIVDLSLYDQYKKEKKEIYLKQHLRKQNKEKKVENKLKINFSFPIKFIELPKEFIDIYGTPGYEYLKQRKLTKFHYLFYYCKDDIELDGKIRYLKDSIIIPLTYKDKFYGFQARKIDKKSFYTYLPPENSGFKVWNYFNIDRSKTIYVFESVFDALSSELPLNQIISAMGSDIPLNLLENLDVVFCYDNHNVDETARKKLLKLANKGNKVFIWPKEIKEKDFNDLLKVNFKDISNIIKNNIEQGLKAYIKLKL